MEKSAVSAFIKNQAALIVEPSEAFVGVIKEALHKVGLTSDQIFIAKKYSDAESLIKDKRPKILVSEFKLGTHFGLGLLETQQQFFGDLNRVSVIVSSDSSESAVAEAAEEQVDAYIVKPFSSAHFQSRLDEVFQRKASPSPYVLALQKAKELQKEKKYDEAIEVLRNSVTLSTNPTLALFHQGDCYMALKQYKEALACFRNGRTVQNMNYKCICGEFDVLMELREFARAFELVEVIRKNFPVTSARLAQFFIAAVYTRNFQELMPLSTIYLEFDYKPAELVSLVSLAFLTAGRIFIKQDEVSKASEFFEHGLSLSGRNTDYLEKIIVEFIKVNASLPAQKFLRMMPADQVGEVKGEQLTFMVESMQRSNDKLIDLGRKLVSEGNSNPYIAKRVIELLVDQNKKTLAESLVIKASELHPEIKKELYNILEKHQNS